MTLYKNNDILTDILTKDRIYTIPTTLTLTDKTKTTLTPTPTPTTPTSITLEERVNCGNMSDYKLLSILQKLKNEKADLTEYTKNDITKLNLQSSTTTKSPALFIMLAHIKCFSGDDETLNKLPIVTQNQQLTNTLQKICTAEYDTLEFAQSISSTSQPVIAKLVTQPLQTLSAAPVVARQSKYVPRLVSKHQYALGIGSIGSKGGSITNPNPQQKTQKNIKKFDFSSLYKTQNSTNKYRSNTIKQHYNNTNKSIFKYKSKKHT